ncbi:Alpha/Beta hydrolase protein [Bisporella sp. PMI_857]|nr:Alpha/Beta hydrolase protein [Bisporella sp. PMI_857]
MVIEIHVPIPLRNGFHAFGDIYRPVDELTKAPTLLSWTPYGKHNPGPLHVIYPKSGTDPSWISDYTNFEAPDPVYWTKYGYAIAIVDIAGTWLGEGNATYSSGAEEAEFHYDTIEWLAKLPWSNGKVGLSGVSYLAVSQWHVAALNPPSLACICPDEGWTDFYREVVRHGGIPCTSFFPYIAHRWGAAITEHEDLLEEAKQHPFFDALWESKKAKLENITVPAFVIASFSDQGLHTRGTLEGYKKIRSAQKWLLVHRRRKWEFYYTPRIVEKQRAFYEKFLKGVTDSPVEKWPKVLLEVSDRSYQGNFREELEWPLSRQLLTPLYLDSSARSLSFSQPKSSSSFAYDAQGSGLEPSRAIYQITFDKETEISGHISATLYMETTSGDDMDVFVALFKLDNESKVVGLPFYAVYLDGPLALGWLRASHRELDTTLSSPEQPILSHQREMRISQNKIYELNIEILPSSVVYNPGEKLCLVVQGTDITRRPLKEVFARHDERINDGMHRIWSGGDYQSRLLVPIIPDS